MSRDRLSRGRSTTQWIVVVALVVTGAVPMNTSPSTVLMADAASGGSAVSVPEHPEGQSFNPTQIKDIAAGDPGSGIGLVDPPQASSTGDARLAYPLETPPGRAGIAPALAVTYSSAGGNGWAGVGWDVAQPMITIDTRWGVPRYSATHETETYLLNGEQLTPLAHRSALVPRTAEKVFHTRVEGRFERIVRHGTGPANYWWEVTDKSGTVSTYGNVGGARLADAHGNVGVWGLRDVRDANGNLMRHTYAAVSDPGVAGGTVDGTNLYLQKISYTGSGETEGRYTVTFQRDRERGEARRPDVQIDARLGFKRVTADLLRRVEVRLDDTLVRAYELSYRTGAYHKTLLASVTQRDADDHAVATHGFDYFDDVRDADGGYNAFAASTAWTMPGDGLDAGIVDGDASALSSSETDSVGGHLYVGYNPTLPTKSGSAGAKVGYSSGSSEGLVALTDVNGDSLPDKVFRTGSGVFYRANQSGPGGEPRFAATPVRLTNLPGISSEESGSGTVGIESYFGVAAQLDYVRTSTTSERYLSDVNGDGITDLVNNGGVLFGRLDANGNPVYTVDSAETGSPVGGGAVSGTIVGTGTAEFERQVDAFPLLDSVRRWVAPYDGTVSVTGSVALRQDTSAARAAYGKADGVRVAIQHEDTERWAVRIGPDDHTAKSPSDVTGLQVSKGDRLYFRVQSVLDGRYDEVSWDPVVTYTDVTPGLDANNLPNERFTASQDFTLGGRTSQVVAPVTGTIRLSGAVTKAATSDDVVVAITRNGTDVVTKTLSAASEGTTPVDLDVAVTQGDELSWQLRSDSPVNAAALHWVPRAHYIAAASVPVTDSTGTPTISITPPYQQDLYPATNLTSPQAAYTATEDTTLSVQPSLDFDAAASADGQVVVTVKKRNVLLAKQVVTVTDGVVPAIDPMTVQARAGDELFFDFSTRSTTLLARLGSSTVEVTPSGGSASAAPSAFHAAEVQGAFPVPHRGWGAIGYEGNRTRATAPIVQSDLVLDEAYGTSLPDGPTEADVPGFTANPSVATPKFVVFMPVPAEQRWAGSDAGTWVARSGASSSRLGLDTIDVASDAAIAGARAVARRGRTEQVSATFGAGPLGGSRATGEASSSVDFLDLNGDRYPDVVGSAGVQYSDMVGGLGSTRGSLGGKVRESDSTAYSISASGGSPARTTGTARGRDVATGAGSANTSRSGLEMPGLGFGGNLGGGDSEARHDLADINGDALPDKVYDNGDAALNLGYSFAAREPWPGGPLNEGETKNAGVNLGFNTDYYGFAGGVSASTGSSTVGASLMDVNGDGLTDRVFAGNPITVGLNKGNGFAAPVPFRGSLSGIGVDKNANFGAGAYFTFGFCFIGGCVVFNPGADTSTGIGRTELALQDVNGDGYTDHVRSTKDGELVVAENRNGRTNLLKTVTRPLGARVDLDFTRDGNTTDAPESRWVLSKVALFDGHVGDGSDTRLTTFAYAGGRYDRFEREFYGYGKVVAQERNAGASNALYRSLTSEYRTDSFYAKGLPTRTATTDAAGHTFSETVTTYALRDVATGTTANAASPTATVFPHATRRVDNFYEGQAAAGKSTSTETSYDELGNLSRTLHAGDTGTADDLETRMTYSGADPACRAKHIVGVATSSRSTAPATGALLRRSEATVDCATANRTQVREYLADGTAAVTDMTYLANGNLQSVTDPVTKHGQRYQVSYGYDSTVGVHVQSTTDSFGYRSTAAHDLRFGKPSLVTDENGQELRTAYDALGRADSVTGPYERGTGRATIDFEYHPEAAVPYAVTRHLDRAATGVRPDTIDTITFIDGTKRVLQTKKDASVAVAPGATPEAVMTVSGRVKVDFVGRVVETYYPLTEPKGATNTTFNAGFDSVPPTRTSFDVLDRSTRSELPDGTFSTTRYGFGADRAGTTQFETVTTDANGKQRKAFENVRRLMTSVQELNPAGGQPVIWTSYAHDPLDQIVKVVDDRGNTTTSSYDNLGRRTVIDNPDSGRTETRYDLAGNVTERVTANLRASNKAIQYDYEFNRLAAIRYPTFSGNNVTYTYGAPGAPENGADRVVAVKDGSGTETRGYGPFGELTRETRTVPEEVLNGPARTYTTQYAYDAFNRVLTLVYPDGERLTYEYDSGGLVNRATGRKGEFDYTYLARQDYDKFESTLLTETGTGVRTTHTYDARDRHLAKLMATLPDGYRFQDVSYTYDNVGNVLELRNDVALPHGKPVGGPSKQTYAYDDLYRLTSARGEYRSADNKLDRYTLDLTYDTIHNTVSKDQRHEIVVSQDLVLDSSTSPTTTPVVPVEEPVEDPVITEPLPDPGTELPLGVVEEPDPAIYPELETQPIEPIEPTEPTAPTAPTAPTQATQPGDATTQGSVMLLGEHVQPQKQTSYDYAYEFRSAKPHAPSKIGPMQQAYDANGNLVDTTNTLPPAPGKRRQLVWDEENRLACNQDHNRNQTVAQVPSTCTSPQQPATVRYHYDDAGTRVVKIAGNQHIYPNQHYSERSGTAFKHIYVGDTRLLTKTVKPDSSEENHVFYFHPDHLGSSGYVTDEFGHLTEHIEYFASGEPWVDEHPAQPTPVPYQYSAKEVDEETGLSYYGARYYNPRTSTWQSPDPALASYLDGGPNGGVYSPSNLAMYSYANNNPVKFTDPSGLWGKVGHNLVMRATALAMGYSPKFSQVLGTAAYAPDEDDRVATDFSSAFLTTFLPSFALPMTDSYSIHLLNGGSAAETQRVIGGRFKDFMNSVPLNSNKLSEQQENTVHSFGDSFAHVDVSSAGRFKQCPCMYGLPFGHMALESGMGARRDNPHYNKGQFMQYVDALQSAMAGRAKTEQLSALRTPAQHRAAMERLTGIKDEAAQTKAINAYIAQLEREYNSR